ncbi:hypothetical protein FHS51_001901 [Sphingobium wenxiniae]|jgi:hypothetical protein|uniref:Uncharacterized protein n=2 Tax=Sphingobium TaxID=165695 RepID=T0GM40_9SPHN|nr:MULTISPECIES: hypothetical protein [Sphingobium]EQB01742.1 hypothetical protein L485_10005 [Sphingobium baderi LL03]KMS62360.1 hypothetical protein V475_08465 [Sphingobium baderi LL03]MBB6191673.1 hypothetical protein [Sphingobium wenxiniae]TWH92728.1 hypothetical protein IQ35_02387 [Sphingobium wenxiniae]WRD76490.1 hypothetical protein QQ987_17380 [Sphingobium baderi]
MIVALIVASLAAGSPASASVHSMGRASPCQAVPALCLKSGREESFRITEETAPGVDNKMRAYGFDARPCRIIGNLDCPKRANRTLFRLGEPVEDTLLRSFRAR